MPRPPNGKMTDERFRADFLNRVFRTACDVDFVSNEGQEADRPAGSLVMVMGGEQVLGNDPDSFRMSIVLLTETGAPAPGHFAYSGCWEGMLIPEPGVPLWLEADIRAADSRAWGIDLGEDVDGNPRYSLDEDGEIEEGESAERTVWAEAVRGDAVACRALAFLRARQPDEYDRIKAAADPKPQRPAWEELELVMWEACKAKLPPGVDSGCTLPLEPDFRLGASAAATVVGVLTAGASCLAVNEGTTVGMTAKVYEAVLAAVEAGEQWLADRLR